MADGLSVSVAGSFAAIAAADWNACAGTANPFTTYEFLAALEESGSTTGKTGWLPRPLLVHDGAGILVGAAPAYLKSHSYGEYVFDHGWAEAYQRAGGRYYPKLQVAVPFTPATGPRLLVRPQADGSAVRRALAEGLQALATETGTSGVHATFLQPADAEALSAAGYIPRHGLQFHWENRGYADFDDFLGALASRKRKQLRKEREAARAAGLQIGVLRGAEITPRHWDAFYRFYQNTIDRKWGWAYLTRAFFDLMTAALGERVLLVVAQEDGEPVAGALNLLGGDTLYGRNWGCGREVPFLHFECCYYQAIDFAIAHGLARVEAGAQGQHKIQRGYLPVLTRSAHWLADPALARAVSEAMGRERVHVGRELSALAALSPYRRDGPQAAA